MEILDTITKYGLPVVIGLIAVAALIAIADRHPRRRVRKGKGETDGRGTGGHDPG